MKRMFMIAVSAGLPFGFFDAAPVNADCSDYKIVCQDGTCHGPYGTCWHWKKLMCVPCHDNNASVCDGHVGPKCLWFSSAFDDIALAFLCKYLHIPNKYCVVCLPPPACVK